jgi:hypothetical protein
MLKFHPCRRVFIIVLFTFFLGFQSFSSLAAYESRFDAMNFTPAVDGGDYFTVYGSDTLALWQGHLGFYLDYANRPLQFAGTGGFAGTRQGVIDHTVIANFTGAIGFTEWFTFGLNVPVVAYNWFFADTPVAAPTGASDHAAMMGDLDVVTKFRLLDIGEHDVGVALIPRLTLPTGDVVRYAGSGHVTGGATLVTEFQLHERFNVSLNLGAVLRDHVLRHGIDMDDQFSYGVGANYKITPQWQMIVEGFGTTVMKDFFSNSNTSPFEAGLGFRHYFGETGISWDVGGNVGLIDGVGSPRFRVLSSLQWTSPVKKIAPPPDTRIQGNKIVLLGKIYYDTNKTTIKPVSYPVLDDVVSVLRDHPEITLIEVQGHTDARASDEYNLRLSQGRAESAMQYLVGKGISSGRLRAVGYGESRPIASNDTPVHMSENRRTEFIIISSSGNIQGQTVNTPVPAGITRNEVMTTSTSSAASHPVPEPTSMAGDVPNYSYPPASPL